jgi:hypothetical protein
MYSTAASCYAQDTNAQVARHAEPGAVVGTPKVAAAEHPFVLVIAVKVVPFRGARRPVQKLVTVRSQDAAVIGQRVS